MKRPLIIVAILAIAALSACATRSLTPSAMPAATQAPAFEAPGLPSAGQALGGGGPQDSFSQGNKAVGQAQAPAAPAVPGADQPVANRLVIQNAQLSVVVADVNARVKSIETMATSMGGFIVSVNVYQTVIDDGEPVPQAQIVVRVPQEKLEDALTQIKKDTVDVQNETRSGTDVTDQYVDLQSRLKAKQAAEAQLLAIMADAKRTEDVLAVYSQLQQIESDIEVLKGQIKYYEQSAALSAISVNIVAEATVKPIKVAGWVPAGVARDAIQQLIFFWQDFVDFLIRVFLFILPVLLTIALPLYLLFLVLRWVIRKTRKPKALAQAETPKQ